MANKLKKNTLISFEDTSDYDHVDSRNECPKSSPGPLNHGEETPSNSQLSTAQDSAERGSDLERETNLFNFRSAPTDQTLKTSLNNSTRRTRTPICKFWKKNGSCLKKGCKFLHGSPQINPKPRQQKTHILDEQTLKTILDFIATQNNADRHRQAISLQYQATENDANRRFLMNILDKCLKSNETPCKKGETSFTPKKEPYLEIQRISPNELEDRQ